MADAVLPWKPIRIMPLGDIQYGSAGCDIGKLKDYISEGLAADAWFLGMGDFHDVMSPSNRRKMANAALYDNAIDWMENKMMEDIGYLYEDVLKPTRGRWIGWLEGHHLWEFTDGSTTDTELARMVGAPFLGTCGFISLEFQGKRETVNCDIWCHHGSGGGSTVGAVINKLERVAGSFDADIYLMGHANRLTAAPKPFLGLGKDGDQMFLKNKERYLVATGAFDRGYTVGSRANKTGRPRGGYVEQGMMLPTGMGASLIEVTPVMGEQAGWVSGDKYGTVTFPELRIRVTV